MSLCIAVGLDRTGVDRITRALSGPQNGSAVRVVAQPQWEAAWSAARSGELVGVVFDPFADGSPDAGWAAFGAAHPGLWLVAYAPLPLAAPGSLARLLRSGVHVFITRDVDDTPAGILFRLRQIGVLRGSRPMTRR